MTAEVIYDLFSGAGGAAAGYADAGFTVIGFDLAPQPNYPFEFYQVDFLDVLHQLDSYGRAWELPEPSAVHSSPPCHDYSTSTGTDRRARGEKGTAWMLPEVRERLGGLGLPYVIENVEGARKHMIDPVRLCGSSFGMDIRRHRYFEANWPLTAPPCDHAWQTPRFRSLMWKNRQAGKLASVVGVHGHLQYPGEWEIRQRAMGIDWMTNDELCESIPPTFTKHIGDQLMAHLRGTA
jgi:DNA (cytosine-5)-methyltransferase 1